MVLGGAHPNGSSYVVNYDLRTGKTFVLDHAFGTPKDMPYQLAALMAKLYFRHYREPASPEDASDCRAVHQRITSDPEEMLETFTPDRLTLFISQRGLVMIPALVAYVEQGCVPDVTIPYGEPYVRKQSPLHWLIEKDSN